MPSRCMLQTRLASRHCTPRERGAHSNRERERGAHSNRERERGAHSNLDAREAHTRTVRETLKPTRTAHKGNANWPHGNANGPHGAARASHVVSLLDALPDELTCERDSMNSDASEICARRPHAVTRARPSRGHASACSRRALTRWLIGAHLACGLASGLFSSRHLGKKSSKTSLSALLPCLSARACLLGTASRRTTASHHSVRFALSPQLWR
jgi:hypothetical protein